MKPVFNMREALLGAVPSLRAFGISLTGDVDRADDLVQDTLLRALANVDRFEPGTNLNAWLFTILRNLFHSEYRKRRREVEDADGSYAATLRTAPDQQAHLDFEDLRAALAKLPPDQREALLLVGAQGVLVRGRRRHLRLRHRHGEEPGQPGPQAARRAHGAGGSRRLG